MAAAAAAAPAGDEDDAMFSAEEDMGDEDDDEECRICRLPAEADRPLRHPCACRGSIRFVHDDCQLQWIATRHQQRCEVCKRDISIRLLYAPDAPSRLPIYEFIVGLHDKLTGLLLPLAFIVFVVCVVPEFITHLTNLWAWRLALATSFGQVHYLLSLRLSAASVLALFALLVAIEHWTELFDIAPFARWVDRAETQLMEVEGFDGLQVFMLYAVEAFLTVVIFDMCLACILGFLPFSVGRIILWCISCSGFSNGDEVNSYTSTVSVLLIGYGFIIPVGVIFAVSNTCGQYLRREHLMTAMFVIRLPGLFLRWIKDFITVTNLKLLTAGIRPLLFGWALDICTSKVVGATISQRFKLLFVSSFSSTALHWVIGHIFMYLFFRQSRLVHKILRPRVALPSVVDSVDEIYYVCFFKTLRVILIGIIYIVVAIFVPVQIAGCLAPALFPLDIECFSCPAKGLSFWQAPRNYADSLSRVLLLSFLIHKTDTLIYLGWLLKKVTRYSFSTSLVIACSTVVIFNSAVLIFPISIGRALLLAITQLPLASRLKPNDLLAFVVGFNIISTIIAVSRDYFSYMATGKAHLPALNRYLVKFLWIVIVPLMIGSLVDLLLIPLLAGPDDDVPVFYIWYMGYVLLRTWLNLVDQTTAIPFLAYFIDERWGSKIARFQAIFSGPSSLLRFFQVIFMPMATKLLAAIGVPYVLANGVFPRFGYSDAVNSTVYRFAWLGILGFGAICYLAKVLCVELHGSIRDDRYVIGKRVEDAADKPDGSGDINNS